MELELKHVLPYLNHGLNLMIDGVVCEIEGVDLHQVDTIIAERVNYKLSQVKPVLRPLSDLTKEFEVNGEKLIPCEEFYNLEPFECSFLELQEHITNLDIDSMTYFVLQRLLMWHFDVYKLIEQGLAIDKNTLK